MAFGVPIILDMHLNNGDNDFFHLSIAIIYHLVLHVYYTVSESHLPGCFSAANHRIAQLLIPSNSCYNHIIPLISYNLNIVYDT